MNKRLIEDVWKLQGEVSDLKKIISEMNREQKKRGVKIKTIREPEVKLQGLGRKRGIGV